MADYISREAALDMCDDDYDRIRIRGLPAADVVARDCYDRTLAENDMMREQLAQIGKKPGDTMDDVRPVVRCKDCKYYKKGKLLGPTKFCYFYQIGTGLNTADDDFCSKGERREPNLDTTKGENHD